MVNMPLKQNQITSYIFYIYIYIYIYKDNLALNNQQWLICHKTQLNQIIYIYEQDFELNNQQRLISHKTTPNLTVVDSHGTLHLVLGLVSVYPASKWAVTKFSHSLFGVWFSVVFFRFCNSFLTISEIRKYYSWLANEDQSYRRCPWCSRYRRRNWTRRHEFKSWTRLIAFHIALIPLGKVWIQLFSLQLWVNSRTD